MTTETSTPLADGTRFGALWVANLLGPVAALVGLEVAYIFVHRACRTGDELPVHLTWAVCLAAALFAGWLGHREWRRWGARHPDEQGGPEARSRFLALLGMLISAMAALTVVAQWSGSFFFHPCQ